MKRLPTRHALARYYEELVFTEAALGADPMGASLAGQCQPLIAEWYENDRTKREACKEVMGARAVVLVKQRILDQELRSFAGILLVESNHNRDSRFFKRFFRTSPSALHYQPLTKQVEHVCNVLLPELDKLEEGHPLKGYRERLDVASRQADESLAAQAKAKASLDAVSKDVAEWKEKVNGFRLTIYGELLKLSAEKRYSRAWADSFFRTRPRSASNSQAPEEAEAAEPQPHSQISAA